ncbi:MAG: hypothetical protein KAS32_27695 [Candidatus Peribacteraceae bacterium]|nr:hypothetical protein [Candidatus Peribacteraceae bacterium]
MTTMTSEQTMIDTLLPALNVRLQVSHLHSGNTSRSKRHGKKYVTIAKLIDKVNGTLLGKGIAQCCKADIPNRKMGRGLAVARAITDAATQNNS